MLAFDTGPGVAVIDGVAAAGGPAALVRSRRADLPRAGHGPTRRVLAELLADPFFAAAAAQEHRARALRRRLRRGAARGACPGPTASPPRSSSPRGASRRGAAAGLRAGAEVVASGGGCHHPGLMAALERHLARRPAIIGSGGSSDLFFPGRRQGSGRVRAARVSHAARAAGQRPRRDRRARRPRPRHGDPGMSAFPVASIPPAWSCRRCAPTGRRLRPRGRRASPTRSTSASAGFIIFGGTVESVRRLTADLLRRAGRPLLIASDLERGAGQQVAGLTEFPPPLALAVARRTRRSCAGPAPSPRRRRARSGSTGCSRRSADLDVLPDNPIVQTRAFGDDPNRVASLVRTWIEGCQDAGALACAKHFPGHGRTTVDSHIALPVVTDAAGHAARERPAAVRHRGRERRGVAS